MLRDVQIVGIVSRADLVGALAERKMRYRRRRLDRLKPGAVVRDVARQADVTSSLIYRWRRDLRAAANGFAQVLVAGWR